MDKRYFTIRGMHCAACAAAVERAVKKLPGCEDAYVNFASGELSFIGTPEDAEIIKAIAKAGFEGSRFCKELPSPEAEDQERVNEKKALGDLLTVWIAGVVLIVLSSLLSLSPWLQSLLLIPVLWGGRRFFMTGIPAFLRGTPDMNSLIASGVISGIAYSWISVLFHKNGPLFFHASAMIIMLIMLGKFLEIRTRRKAAAALRGLVALTPENAICLKEDGSEKIIPASEAAPGMKFKVLPGAKVPADGKVLSGNSSCDESMFTGESLPALKHPGAQLFGGSINLEGVLIMECSGAGKNSMLSKIIDAVKAAQGSRVPMGAIADKVAGFFVWGVFAIALMTFLVYLLIHAGMATALNHAMCVLVIACPCALGLAAPIALICSIGKGASAGILIKNGSILEQLAKTRVVVFDKTGTLTTGKFTVLRIDSRHEKWNSDKILAIAAALEKMTSHPLAYAVLEEAKKNFIEPPEIDEVVTIPGYGVKGGWGGKTYEIGREEDPSCVFEGASTMLLKENGSCVGRIFLRDTLRPEAVETVRALQKMGLRVEMLTGDNSGAAAAVADELHLDGFHARMLPAEKSQILQELRSQYGAVAMVGDGINDAPALAAADSGIAIGSATAIAIETAEVVLISNNLKNVPAAFDLSRRTMKIIKENLCWAFLYNLCGITFAMGLFEPYLFATPAFCAAAMGASSVTVVLNALRLKVQNFSMTVPN